MSLTSRKCFLDLLRILSCFFVIVNHTNSSIFLGLTPKTLTWYISLSYFYVSKVAVPIFFMITGYLLLGKIETWKKTFQRFIRILVVLFMCAVIYTTYNALFVNESATLATALKNIISVYIVCPSNAFWYLYTYMGILLMLPFLQKMAQLMSRQDYHIFFLISGFVFSILPILNHYFDWIALNVHFELPLFGSYICFLFVGQYYSRFSIQKTTKRLLIAVVLFAAMVVFNVVATYFEYQKSSTNYLFFDNRVFFPIVLESVCVFYIATFFDFSSKTQKILSYISSCTFGIYLISDLTITVFYPHYEKFCSVIHPLLAVLLFEFFVFALGFVITILLKKIPYIKKYL